MNKHLNIISKCYIFFMFFVLYLPIMYLLIYSFNKGGDMTSFTGFTLDYYVQLFEDTRLFIFVLNTFIIAIISAMIATMIGTIGAIGLYLTRSKKNRQMILNINNILLVTPDVMMGASFLILFSSLLPIKLGFTTVLLAHVAFSVPIVVLMVLPQLYEMNATMIVAAKDLGANLSQIISQIIIPNITKGIISGFLMALTYSLDDFAVTFFVTGNGFSTLSVEIYSRARQGVNLEINALSTIMFIVLFSFAIGYYLIKRQQLNAKAGG